MITANVYDLRPAQTLNHEPVILFVDNAPALSFDVIKCAKSIRVTGVIRG